jgi:hypothetical protein
MQLDQMAAMYDLAVLILVALTGAGASHGLPGVSYPRPAMRQAQAMLNENVQFVSSVQGVEKYLRSSRWMKRGWTYQECAASSRLLFFNRLQVVLPGTPLLH